MKRSAPSAEPGTRIYAIGDVHGCYDLLRELLRRIEQHSRGLPQPERLHVVLLGDVVDRGPDTARCLAFLHEWMRNTSGQILLTGNHEEMLVRVYCGEGRLLLPWSRTGGSETLRSFGLPVPDRNTDIPAYLRAMRVAIPATLIEWIKTWPLTAQSGDFFFCHAGVRPGVAIRKQKRNDLIWIREDFLHHQGDLGAVVVHGHTISDGVDRRPNRVGIDTGAYQSGVLTAMYIEGSDVDFISTEPVTTGLTGARANPEWT